TTAASEYGHEFERNNLKQNMAGTACRTSYTPYRSTAQVLLSLGLVAVLALGVAAAQPSQKSSSIHGELHAGLQLSSDAFGDGRRIPTDYTCDGSNVSPPFSWTGAPVTAKSFALIWEDRDAGPRNAVHWVIYNIPAAVRTLPSRVPPDITLDDGTKQGRNGSGRIGYTGPCPAPGNPHRNLIHLYALDSMLDPEGPTRDDVQKAMKGHVLAEASLAGIY
ncbi:MAG TPA: YbhB/YbcL family Raf kinase inhibitor-like protein, partial [Blastocatellia bacterium]|nr:YbhB/YbcL family Raf kinase inhibitor-like protein [Blastocatellia bacterium]